MRRRSSTARGSQRTAAVALLLGLSAPAGAQHVHDPGLYGEYPMAREASGTGWQPEASPMEGLHTRAGAWSLMLHGVAHGIYTRTSGARRDAMLFSTSMGMLVGRRRLGPGAIGLRAMATLEPLMGPRGYPLLFQTGESADGRESLFDRQHPHDAFMELAATWSLPLGKGRSAFAYLGLPGDPALGPPAFMHRPSAADNPAAPIGHHWLDATHISHGVATLGVASGALKLDASAFNGREPDHRRWGLEAPRLDSFAVRATLNPGEAWSLQVSVARLRAPERLHPGVDVVRVTASAAWTRASRGRSWSALLAFGQNVKDRAPAGHVHFFDRFGPSRRPKALLLESSLRLRAGHAVFLRAEYVEKEELFTLLDPFHARTFPVFKVDAGSVRDLWSWRRMHVGVGATASLHWIPDILAHEYGGEPRAFMVFGRASLH